MDPGIKTTTRPRGRPPRPETERARSEALAVAFEALYRAFFVRLVRRAAWRFHLSKEDASEVVQDAFIVALAKLDMEGDPIAWLYRTVDNLALNCRRKIDRRAGLIAEWGAPDASAREEGGEP